MSQTPAGTPPGATAAAPVGDNPLGFLGALIDQLLAGGLEAATGLKTEAGAATNIPALLDLDFGSSTAITPEKTEIASSLLAALTARLDGVAGRIEAGAPPSPGELPQLQAAVDALISVLGAAVAKPEAQQAAPSTVAAAVSADVAAPAPAIPNEQITQLLASLGLVAPQRAAAPATATVAAEVQPATDIIALRNRLTAMAQSVAATAPELAQKLTTLAAKLEPIAADPVLAAQFGLAAPQPDPDALTIAHIIRSLLGHGTETPNAGPAKPATPEPAASATPAPQLNDELLQVLASLGLNTPPATTTAVASETPVATASVAAATAVPQPLLRLSTQLSQVAAELSATAPELAKKLEAVATRLVSADADPNLLGKLTSAAAQPSGTPLDTLVKALIEAKPVTPPAPAPAAPQIAAPQQLPVPAPIAPTKSKSAVAEVKAAPPEPAPVTADSAPKPAQNVTVSAVAQEPASDPKPEAKAEAKAAAIIADTTKSDPAAQPSPAQPQQAPAAAQQARALPAAYQPVANPINMGQVAFEMVRQVHQGTSRFTIRLDPPELGRVDVKMHVDNTGTVNARLTVDRAETLDLFQRDRQSLERALSQAGLDGAKTNLEFSLRQQHNPFAGMMGDQRQHQPGYGSAPRFSLASSDETSAPAITLYRGTASAGGVNIFA
jgi:flagellar hook-length control protein FliK